MKARIVLKSFDGLSFPVMLSEKQTSPGTDRKNGKPAPLEWRGLLRITPATTGPVEPVEENPVLPGP